MAHLRPVILAFLLVVAMPAAAVPSSAPSSASQSTVVADNQAYAPTNTSSVLTLGADAEETRAFATVSLDVGATLASQRDDLERRITSQSFEMQFSRATTRGEKRDLLLKYVTRIDTRVTQLEMREQRAREGFRNGSLSAGDYIHTLARIDMEARRLHQEVKQVDTYTNEVPQFTLKNLLGQLNKRLISLEGSVRNRVILVEQGNAPSITVYVAAADNGLILSTVTEGTYLRELYRSDHRDTDSQGAFNFTEELDILSGAYPYATEQAEEKGYGTDLHPHPSAGYNFFTLAFNHGQVSGYMDKGTGLVFQETQRKYLTPVAASRNGVDATRPRGPSVTANESGLLLTVNRSYPGGPMYVALQDNETGEHVEGSIAVDGETVGRTSTEGGLWTLSHAGSFNVSASSGLDVVTVATRATRPIRNHNATQS